MQWDDSVKAVNIEYFNPGGYFSTLDRFCDLSKVLYSILATGLWKLCLLSCQIKFNCTTQYHRKDLNGLYGPTKAKAPNSTAGVLRELSDGLVNGCGNKVSNFLFSLIRLFLMKGWCWWALLKQETNLNTVKSVRKIQVFTETHSINDAI